VTGEYHLDTIIMHSFDNGIAMDSSWRHMNANKCPVTFITTLNDHFRMIPGRCALQEAICSLTDSLHRNPGFAFITENIRSATLVKLLRKSKQEIETRAQEIVTKVSKGITGESTTVPVLDQDCLLTSML
jgi:hypothetical protein